MIHSTTVTAWICKVTEIAKSALGVLGRLFHDRADLGSNLRQPRLQAVALDGPDEGCGILAVQRWRPPIVLQQ